MAVTYPFALDLIAERVHISSVVFDIQRNDQFSGLGSGMFWQAELSPPLWIADCSLAAKPSRDALSDAAIIRSLNGSQGTFYLFDPQALYPADDPDGTTLGSSTITVTSVGSNKRDIALEGFPPGYRLRVGDKMQITHTGAKESFHEVSRTVDANGSGQMATVNVFPAIPAFVAPGDAVILKKPSCLMVIMPGSHNPGSSDGVNTTGASFKAIQKKT